VKGDSVGRFAKASQVGRKTRRDSSVFPHVNRPRRFWAATLHLATSRVAPNLLSRVGNVFWKTITYWWLAIRGAAQNRRGRTMEQDTSVRAEFFALPW